MYKSLVLAAAVAMGGVASSPVRMAPSVITPLRLGQQNCFDSFSHRDVSAGHQEDNIYRACQAAGTIGPDDEGVSVRRPVLLGPDYRYYVRWVPGCVTTVPAQEIWGPIPGDGGVTCPGLLGNDFLGCDNGGAGGWIDAGCLRYTFSVAELPKEWS